MASTDSTSPPTPATAWCRDCEQWKPLAEFYKARGRKNGDTPVCYCITCYNRRCRAYAREKYATDPGFRERVRVTTRRKVLRLKYGLTEEGYESLLADQHGGCAICGATESAHTHGRPCRLAVDHDHTTGKVRGLLCSRCNQAIGKFGDDPEMLRAAAAYLDRHKG